MSRIVLQYIVTKGSAVKELQGLFDTLAGFLTAGLFEAISTNGFDHTLLTSKKCRFAINHPMLQIML